RSRARKRNDFDLEHECPRDDSTCRHSGFPLAPGAPRPATGRRHKAGLLAPGSVAFARLPRPLRAQWQLDEKLAGHSCGGSRGVTPRSLTLRVRELLRPNCAVRQCGWFYANDSVIAE